MPFAFEADLLDGVEAAALEESAEIDADILAHAGLSSAHHEKTTSFADLVDTATDAQIPDDITVDHAATADDADTVDGRHYSSNWPTTLANIQSACGSDFHAIGGTDDDGEWSDAGAYIYADNAPSVVVTDDGRVGIGTVGPQVALSINGGIGKDGSSMYGTNASTHVNLGVSSSTGYSGFDHSYVTIGGGYLNDARLVGSTLCGGRQNTALGTYSFIGGGWLNEAADSYCTVSGGYDNYACGQAATVSGGSDCEARGDWSAVPGGSSNVVEGDYSVAMGRHMHLDSTADNTFVWGHAGAQATITTPDVFIIYTGNCGIGTSSPGFKLEVDGSAGKPGGGSWSDSSDARLKKDIRPMDGKEALRRLTQLKGRTYSWVHPEEHREGREAGLVAQEVEAVFPDWVEEYQPKEKDTALLPEGEKA